MNIITICFLIASLIQGQVIPGQYIISFRNQARNSFDSNVRAVESQFIGRSLENQVLHKFDSVLNGISAKLDKSTLERVKALPNVEYVEEDGVVYADAIEENSPWGLARISQREKLGSAPYTYNYDEDAGKGVNIYVLDTGINVDHDDFEGRLTWGITTALDSQDDNDFKGHGTHCAGSAAGTKYGVAKKANIIAVKVLGDDGTGSKSDSIAGINWVVENKSGVKGNVITMSIGGPVSEAQNQAVNDAVDKGIIFVCSAGNNNTDSCKQSPASAKKAITVGSITVDDTKSSFSNYGPCVDINGPGSNILSACIGGKSATCIKSGTSMATPHIAGIAATLLSQNVLVGDVEARLKAIATKDKILGLTSDTVNIIGYNGIAK
jgi:cerevisin